MVNPETDILDAFATSEKKVRRRALLPWWIKTFTWIFLVFGALAPVGLIFGAFGAHFDLSLYGLKTNQPLSVLGLSIMAMFLLKGIAAFALWTEKNWAITIGQVDAVIGIAVCVFVMFVYPFIDDQSGFRFFFRLELLLLIPFLLRLRKIEREWDAATSAIPAVAGPPDSK